MRSYLTFILVAMVALVLVACESENPDKLNKFDLSSSTERDSLVSALIKRAAKKPTRTKRRLQDVEKLMAEDEIMSMLICDACDKYSCAASYCQYCDQCRHEKNDRFYGKLEKKRYYYFSDLSKIVPFMWILNYSETNEARIN
ncbi:hypothetical protein BpHYR1_030240 [Brachionus plicatilis]|uniref:Uncharacterized protein n=1 Tax=Brachionus plicatilis TaxID=10195 RepID=A0A3M7RYG3_BRAPC|nr:hypothetical protein BpHYR1_030240 [Brachionus plicatilis]